MTKKHIKVEVPDIYLYSQAEIPLTQGLFNIMVYRQRREQELETVVIAKGNLQNSSSDNPWFVRVHSECYTGEVLGSLKCDCKNQLDESLSTINKENQGLVIYLRQEGRGIGLGNKIRAYALQNKGLNTIEANHALGYPNDLRDFSLAAKILKNLEITNIRLNTNNPDKISGLANHGINIVEVIPSLQPVQAYNRSYLKTKYQKLGHSLNHLFPAFEKTDDHHPST